ncbi:MAG: porin family protein [Steroidobacteraceae bacterium]
MRAGKRVSVCALLILSASAAQAADRGFYFGAAAGQAKYDFDGVPPFAQVIPVAGFIPVTTVPSPIPPFVSPGPPFNAAVFVGDARPVLWLPGDDDEGTAWSVTAGYRVNRYLAIEASYVNLGTLEATRSLVLPLILGGGTLGFHRELETSGPALAAFGILPLSDSWELYVRAGILFADSELTTAINGNSNTVSFDSQSTTLGAGAQFDWGSHWSARLELQRSLGVGGGDVANEADVDGVSLAVLYRL